MGDPTCASCNNPHCPGARLGRPSCLLGQMGFLPVNPDHERLVDDLIRRAQAQAQPVRRLRFDRDDLVRAVLGQQWREAFVILHMCEWTTDRDENRVWCTPHDLEAVEVDWPTADDVVADLLGEVRR